MFTQRQNGKAAKEEKNGGRGNKWQGLRGEGLDSKKKSND
jgi:hypothetical protein